jgi:UDP-2-acetamido-3-amino-2,3-dideoxy-glucuronate N-acetyltransferase
MKEYFVHESSYIDEHVKIGEGTKIWHFSHIIGGNVIGNNCTIGQNVSIGPSMVFTNVINPRSFIERKDEFKRTLVKRGATLGANCTIVCGNTIGEYAMIAAGSVVTKDVPAHSLMMGVPAKQAGWVCECAVRLIPEADTGEGTYVCPVCSKRYEF